MELAEKIKHYRKQRGLTQNELAELLGCSAANISQYEAGKRNPKIGTLAKIAAALNIDLKLLSQEKENPIDDFDDVEDFSLLLEDCNILKYMYDEKEREQMLISFKTAFKEAKATESIDAMNEVIHHYTEMIFSDLLKYGYITTIDFFTFLTLLGKRGRNEIFDLVDFLEDDPEYL